MQGKYLNIIDFSMLSLSNFEVNIWTNVPREVLLNSTSIPKSFEKINVRNIETLSSFELFREYFESDYAYNFKSDLARTIVLRENGGVYLDADHSMIRDDMEELLS